MAKKFPLHPARPERICWGCDKYCPVDDMACGNGSDRTPHPMELFGDDWADWTPPEAGPVQPESVPPSDSGLPAQQPSPTPPGDTPCPS